MVFSIFKIGDPCLKLSTVTLDTMSHSCSRDKFTLALRVLKALIGIIGTLVGHLITKSGIFMFWESNFTSKEIMSKAQFNEAFGPMYFEGTSLGKSC